MNREKSVVFLNTNRLEEVKEVVRSELHIDVGFVGYVVYPLFLSLFRGASHNTLRG